MINKVLNYVHMCIFLEIKSPAQKRPIHKNYHLKRLSLIKDPNLSLSHCPYIFCSCSIVTHACYVWLLLWWAQFASIIHPDFSRDISTLCVIFYMYTYFFKSFPDGSLVKNPPTNEGDAGLIPGFGRSPGEGNGYPLQYSCLENPTDRGGWWATVYGVGYSLWSGLQSMGSPKCWTWLSN